MEKGSLKGEAGGRDGETRGLTVGDKLGKYGGQGRRGFLKIF